MQRGGHAPWWGILSAALSGTVLALRAGGADPGLSLDVVGDQVLVHWCQEGACGTVGIASSLNRIAHGANWIHFRTLWALAGLGDQALHLLLHVSFGVAVALVATAAWRRRGPLAGWLAATTFAALCLLSDLKIAMVYNHRPFPLIGALVAVLALWAVERQRPLLVVLTASVAAIATNIHMATATWGAAMLPVGALALRRRPWAGAALGGISFLAVGIATSPAAWWNNLQVLLDAGGIQGSVSTVSDFGTSLPAWACRVALGIALVRVAWRRTEDSRPGETPVLLALVAAPLLALDGAGLAGRVSPDDKYLIAAQGATALLLAAAAVDLVSRFQRKRLAMPPGPAAHRERRLAAIVLAGFGLLALAPVHREARFLGVDGLPMFRQGDLESIARRLADEPDFQPTHRVFQVREPNERVIRTHLDFVTDWPERDPGPPSRAWTFLKTPPWPLPQPLPAGIEAWKEDGDSRLLALATHPRLDWERFEACERDPSGSGDGLSCHQTGMAVKAPGDWRGSFVTAPLPDSVGEVPRELRVPIRPGPETALASLPLVARCTATLSLEGVPEAQTDPAGRRLVLPSFPQDRPDARLVMRWTVGHPGCRAPETGMPPLVIEGPPEAVSWLWELLDRQGLLEHHARDREDGR
ncbi:MAG TPA: hypothetical protein PLQ97_06600 [Myxococcota bacterium]|nr:hypothetical protein [Myxococcota bacterium]HQK50611.1 hypothetical protein [Myxococcota bacterium]